MFSTDTSRERWAQAQQYERNYWLTHKERAQCEEWIKTKTEKALSLQSWMTKFIDLSPQSRILQIGAAGEGEINFFPMGDRFAIDPLAGFFKAHFGKVIDPRVDFRQAKGEQLPFPDNYFDGIIITNVLDHTEDADLVLREIFRTLKPGGVAIVEVHVFWPPSYFVKKYIKKNVGHPHVFTLRPLALSISASGLRIVDTRHDETIHMYLGHWLKCVFLSRRYGRFAVTK